MGSFDMSEYAKGKVKDGIASLGDDIPTMTTEELGKLFRPATDEERKRIEAQIEASEKTKPQKPQKKSYKS